MNIKSWLEEATQKLQKVNVATARLDCLVLLEDATSKDRSYLLAHPEMKLPASVLKKLGDGIGRRQNHEPLAYIRGKSEFYGREFLVSPDTLEPRPETETMIDLVKGLRLLKGSQIADVGAGSGAIGITLALELRRVQIDMYEISAPAIKVAWQNVKRLNALNCRVYKRDLLSGVKTNYDVIVANLPYVPDNHTINQAAMQEPAIAIFGGSDGLDLYRRLSAQIKELKLKPRLIFTESLPFQHEELANIVAPRGYKLQKEDDFIQMFSL